MPIHGPEANRRHWLCGDLVELGEGRCRTSKLGAEIQQLAQVLSVKLYSDQLPISCRWTVRA
jgi:hypothetical protein